MRQGLIGRAIFVRHGQSEYTNVFPDLTDQGKLEIKETLPVIKKLKPAQSYIIEINSSPAARALGSAAIISEALSFVKIKQDPTIGPPEIRNRDKAMAIYLEYLSRGGMRTLCVAYSSDDRFEDSQIFEPRSEICKRFYTYLGTLIRDMLVSNSKKFFVVVSHYEFFYHFVERVFLLDYSKQDPLGFAETITLFFRNVFLEDCVEIIVAFRGMSAKIVFNHKRDIIVLGPSKK